MFKGAPEIVTCGSGVERIQSVYDDDIGFPQSICRQHDVRISFTLGRPVKWCLALPVLIFAVVATLPACLQGCANAGWPSRSDAF